MSMLARLIEEEAPEGYRYVWEPDSTWSTAPEHIAGKLCRQRNHWRGYNTSRVVAKADGGSRTR